MPTLGLLASHPWIAATAQVAGGPLDALGVRPGKLARTYGHGEVILVGVLVVVEGIPLVLVLDEPQPDAGLAQCTHVRPPILRRPPPGGSQASLRAIDSQLRGRLRGAH